MRKPGCLRAFVCAVCVPASCVLALRSCRSPFAATGSRAHTVLPTRCGVGAVSVRVGVAAGLVWACLLAGG